jgi:hypothetical protein
MVLGRVKFFDAIGIAPVWLPVRFQVRDVIDLVQVGDSIIIGVVKVWVKVRFQARDAIDLDQVLVVPEEQAEDWEGTDVDAASGDGSKNSSDESGQNEDNGLPDTKVQDGVVCLTFFFSEIDIIYLSISRQY